jgi:hypothetical protein
VATLDDWTAQACGALGLDPAAVDRTLVLDLARDAAHGVARPAAPLTTYLVGVAVGAGADPAAAASTIRELIADWPTQPAAEPETARPDGQG